MTRQVVHIGANKAASTTLQRAMFSRHSGLNYVGEDGEGYPEYRDVVNSMIYDDDLHFQADKCDELFTSKLSGDTQKTFLYSSEDVMTSSVPMLCAGRLKKYLPHASVLLIVRNQYTAIPSFYINHGAFLKPAPPSHFHRHVEFEDWMKFQMMFIKYGALASFFYSKFVSAYAEFFGSENIHILLYEEFVQDQKSFVDKLCKILDIDAAEAFTLLKGKHERQSITKRQRSFNRITRGVLGNLKIGGLSTNEDGSSFLQNILKKGPKAKMVIPEFWREKIFDLYAGENKAIADKYRLPLEEYGYPIL